jgi:hypothetical protein
VNSKQYEKLIQECDSILDRFREYPSIIAIPWLHVLNNHPNTLRKYEVLLKKRSIWEEAARVIKSVAYMGYKLVGSVYARGKSGAASETDVLFISHFVQAGMQAGEMDFYYGLLPGFLVSKGISTTTGFIDHTPGNNKERLGKGVLLPKTISLNGEWRIILQCWQSFRRLRKAARKETSQQLKRCLYEAACQSISPQTSSALRLYENIGKLINQTNPSAIIVTWEGWSWERMAFRAAREHNNKTYCIGYQHTILFPGSHALKRSAGKMYDPDTILTLGEIPHRILERSGDMFTHTSLLQYGSHRKTAMTKPIFAKQSSTVCLVTPEGIESECILLFDFAIALAKEIPEMRFIFRTHPVLPFVEITRQHVRFLSLPDNCMVSDMTDINKDFERSDLLLYRGSSVVIYAVLNGLRPIYYHVPGELTIDPLYTINEWRVVVENPYDFRNAVDADAQLDTDKKQAIFSTAKDFCNSYVNFPDPEAVYRRLSSQINNN